MSHTTTRVFHALAALTYICLGYFFLDAVFPEYDIAARLSLLAIPLPFLLFAVFWRRLERVFGGRLMPRLPQRHLPVSAAQTRAEFKSGTLISILAVFLSVSPLLMSVRDGSLPTASAIAPLLVWIWNIRVFGWDRLRIGAMHLANFSPSVDDDILHERARDLLTAVILQERSVQDDHWNAFLRFEAVGMAPEISCTIENHPDPDTGDLAERIDLNPTDILALLAALTDDGNRHRLPRNHFLTFDIDLSAMSSHQRMEKIGLLEAARSRAVDLFPMQRPA